MTFQNGKPANAGPSFFFYSVVVFSPFMKEKYFHHWIIFVCAMYILLQDSVTDSDVTKADLLLRMFLRDFTQLFRAEDFTYNLHNLIHMGLTVRRFGPLGTSSAFLFESLNGDLIDCIHGTKNHAVELATTLHLFQGSQALKARVEAKNICPETLTGKDVVQCRSEIQTREISDDMRSVLSGAALQSPYRLYYRAVVKGATYTSVSYSRQVEKNNYSICYVNAQGIKQYGEVYFFCESFDGKKCMFVKLFNIEHQRSFRHVDAQIVVNHVIPVKLSCNVDFLPVDNIVSKVIRVGDYVCLQPNKIEVNL